MSGERSAFPGRPAGKDLAYYTAEALSHTEMAVEAVNDAIRYPQNISPLWEKAFDGLTKAYDALSAIRRGQ
jgi:hypothetical protein